MSLAHSALLAQLPRAFHTGYPDINWELMPAPVLAVILDLDCARCDTSGFVYTIAQEFARIGASEASVLRFLHMWVISRYARSKTDWQVANAFRAVDYDKKVVPQLIPAEVYIPGVLNQNALLVYEKLYTKDRVERYFELGFADIARETGLQRTCVRRALDELVHKGFLLRLLPGCSTTQKGRKKTEYRFADASEVAVRRAIIREEAMNNDA